MTQTIDKPKSRPRVSDAFLLENRRKRIVTGAARAISECGYRQSTVTDIVRCAGVARNTFYETFGSKWDAAKALADSVCPGIWVSDWASLAALTFEAAAEVSVSGSSEQLTLQRARLATLADLDLRPIAAVPEDDPHHGSLPPGRHGLPEEFVRENQSRRLRSGFVAVVTERGFRAATITAVCSHAAVSRRTFYEYFSSLDSMGESLLRENEQLLEPTRGSGAVAIEIVAAKLAGCDPYLTADALATLGRFIDHDRSVCSSA